MFTSFISSLLFHHDAPSSRCLFVREKKNKRDQTKQHERRATHGEDLPLWALCFLKAAQLMHTFCWHYWKALRCRFINRRNIFGIFLLLITARHVPCLHVEPEFDLFWNAVSTFKLPGEIKLSPCSFAIHNPEDCLNNTVALLNWKSTSAHICWIKCILWASEVFYYLLTFLEWIWNLQTLAS